MKMKHENYVSEVIVKTNKIPPILVSFEHGHLMPSEGDKLKCWPTVLKKKSGDKQRLVAVVTTHLQHQSNASSDMGVTTTFIALRNKKTNKVRLFEMECFTLSQAIAKKEAATDEDAADVSVQYAQLSKSFGSKMAKRKHEQIERTTIHVDNLEGQLTEVTGTMDVAEEDLTFSKEGSDCLKEFLPPFNPEATSVDQVYELTSILSSEEISSLDGICDNILADYSSYNKHSPSKLFTACIAGVVSSGLHGRLKALLYADCLIKFLRLTAKDLSRKDVTLCPYSIPICDNIFRNFTSKSGKHRNRTAVHKDKALCHIIVLGLLACGFQLDLVPLVESLQRIGLKKLQELRRFVGAVPLKDKPNIISLSVPLPPVRDAIRGSKSFKRSK